MELENDELYCDHILSSWQSLALLVVLTGSCLCSESYSTGSRPRLSTGVMACAMEAVMSKLRQLQCSAEAGLFWPHS